MNVFIVILYFVLKSNNFEWKLENKFYLLDVLGEVVNIISIVENNVYFRNKISKI